MHTSTIRGLDARLKLASSRVWRLSDQRKASDYAHDAICLARVLGRLDFNFGRYQLPCFFFGEPLLTEAWKREQDTAFLTYRPTLGDLRGLSVRVALAQARTLRLVNPIAGDEADGEVNGHALNFGHQDEFSEVPALFVDEPELITAWNEGRQIAVDCANWDAAEQHPEDRDAEPMPGCDWRGSR